MEPENVPFMSICILYADSKYMHYSLNGEYETALYRQWFVLIQMCIVQNIPECTKLI
jgi:hypothetical protein